MGCFFWTVISDIIVSPKFLILLIIVFYLFFVFFLFNTCSILLTCRTEWRWRPIFISKCFSGGNRLHLNSLLCVAQLKIKKSFKWHRIFQMWCYLKMQEILHASFLYTCTSCSPVAWTLRPGLGEKTRRRMKEWRPGRCLAGRRVAPVATRFFWQPICRRGVGVCCVMVEVTPAATRTHMAVIRVFSEGTSVGLCTHTCTLSFIHLVCLHLTTSF